MTPIFIRGTCPSTPREEEVNMDIDRIVKPRDIGETIMTVAVVGGAVGAVCKAVSWINKQLFRCKYHRYFEEDNK